MAKSNLTLPLLGLGGVAAIYILTRKKAPAPDEETSEGSGSTSRGRSRFGGQERFKASDHAMCFKTSGLTDADERVIQKMVDRRVAQAPSWDTLDDARETAFQITRGILQGICPSAKLPGSRNVVDNYLEKSSVLDHLWTTIFPKVWYQLTDAEN